MSEHKQLEVVDLGDGHRYELRLDGERVGAADYRVRDGVMAIPYVETEPAHRGKDYAARLMAGVLDDVRARELTVQPICSYAAAYMQRRPDTHDLIAS
jgi:predicted GNAT family acetyltransferase